MTRPTGMRAVFVREKIRHLFGSCVVGAGFLLMLAFLLSVAAGNLLSDAEKGFREHLPRPMLHPLLLCETLSPLLILPGFALTRLIFRLGKRLLAERATGLRGWDERSPVLLLRSFADDHLAVKTVSGVRRFFTGRNYPWDFLTFEEMLVRALAPCGPVVAIGRPGERLPPVGAAREWIGNDAWKERVEELLRECRCVVMVLGQLGPGDGLSWEAREIMLPAYRHKLLIVVPPLSEAAVRSRWVQWKHLLGQEFPFYQGGEVAVTFGPDGRPCVHRTVQRRWLDDDLQALHRPTVGWRSAHGRWVTSRTIFAALSCLLPLGTREIWGHLLGALWWFLVTVCVLAMTVRLYHSEPAFALLWGLSCLYLTGRTVGRYERFKLRVGF